ncbi:MAG: glycosyltransferase family 2 protein [Candidatus Omnitrophica bacterium]|nr:glycosyltransferase family 2 protein [Candidatus Omnitrophota bacterium]
MNSTVSVVIPTCGRQNYFLACVRSLLSQTYAPVEIILVDNSSDRSAGRQIRGLFPGVHVHVPLNNLLYAGGMNKGIELSSGEFVLCLNDDVVLDPSFIAQALNGFEMGCKVGMVNGKILRMDGKTLDSSGLFLTWMRTARERGYGVTDRGQFDKKEFIFGVSGVAALYRRETLDDIRDSHGWFDARFGMFYEDMDLAWRANRSGWQAVYVPTAVALHIRGGTVRTTGGAGKGWARKYLSDEVTADLVRNRYLMIIKNESWQGFLIHALPALFYDLLSWLYLLLVRPRVLQLFLSKRNELLTAWRERGRRQRSAR